MGALRADYHNTFWINVWIAISAMGSDQCWPSEGHEIELEILRLGRLHFWTRLVLFVWNLYIVKEKISKLFKAMHRYDFCKGKFSLSIVGILLVEEIN